MICIFNHLDGDSVAARFIIHHSFQQTMIVLCALFFVSSNNSLVQIKLNEQITTRLKK